MDADIANRDFTGTTIKTPMDKMRAMSIINAKDDTAGLSLINFNITTFLSKNKQADAFFILGLWATEPVRRYPAKFVRFPEAGKQALSTRADSLMTNLLQRQDVDNDFVDAAKIQINSMINKEITYIRHSEKEPESA